MLHLFMNSGLVLILLCPECSFMRHKNQIVVLKTLKICVSPQDEMAASSPQFTALRVCGWNSEPARGWGQGRGGGAEGLRGLGLLREP